MKPAERRWLRGVGWLLTPLVAWAASLFGGWVGALVTQRPAGLILGAVLGAAVAVTGWVVLAVRRAPAQREVEAGRTSSDG